MLGSETDLFKGMEHLLTPADRISWDELCALYDRVAEIAEESGTSVAACGEKAMEYESMSSMLRYARLVAGPKLLYSLGNRYGLMRTFAHLNVSDGVDGEVLWLRITIPEGYQVSKPFFQATQGILRAMPRMLGLAPAQVIAEIDGRTAHYRITPPRSETLAAKIRRALSSIFLGGEALRELAQQQEQLNQQYLELQQAHARLAIALRTKERFLSVINHELRTPLNGIKGTLYALGQAEDRQAQSALMQTLNSCADDISRLVSGILDFNGVEEEAATPFITEVPAAELLDDLQSWAQQRADAKGVLLNFTQSPALPAFIQTDARRLRQAALQVVDNAIKFTDEGQVHVNLHIVDQTLSITVRDTGPGIRPEDQSLVFELFRQARDDSTRGFGGAGLGLALARRLVEFLGGSVSLESDYGHGTTVTLKVPCKVVEQTAPLVDSQDLPARVLVVDDNRVNRKVLRKMLERLNWSVDEAENGREAVTRAENIAYAAVFMDCEMPVMDGFEATRRIRSAVGDDMPVIAVTAYVTEKDRKRCFAAGMNDFLAKPLSPNNISESLNRWIGRCEPLILPEPSTSDSGERKYATG